MPRLPAGSADAPEVPLHLLHVIDARDGVEPLLAARAALNVPGRHDVLLIGDTRDERRAAQLGVITTDRVSHAGG